MFILAAEKKKKIDNQIKELYQNLVSKIIEEHPYIEKSTLDYQTGITNSLSFLLKQGNITVEELKGEFDWFLNRMDSRIINYFGNEELTNYIKDFQSCGIDVDIFIRFDKKPRFSFTYKIDLNLTNEPLTVLKKIEVQAEKKFGYNRNKWIIKEIFTSEESVGNEIEKREGSYKKFISLEFLKFEEAWIDYITDKDNEIKRTYKKSLDKIIGEIKKEEYEWLQI